MNFGSRPQRVAPGEVGTRRQAFPIAHRQRDKGGVVIPVAQAGVHENRPQLRADGHGCGWVDCGDQRVGAGRTEGQRASQRPRRLVREIRPEIVDLSVHDGGALICGHRRRATGEVPAVSRSLSAQRRFEPRLRGDRPACGERGIDFGESVGKALAIQRQHVWHRVQINLLQLVPNAPSYIAKLQHDFARDQLALDRKIELV
ncbi:MAG: hypothetical protein JMDDDDMK_00018 [Acidobacteria bacterium]|nr:hypothetical protein [Acidobacteriota bacterium]